MQLPIHVESQYQEQLHIGTICMSEWGILIC